MTLHLTNPTRRLSITLLAIFSIVATALPTALLLPADASHGPAVTPGGFEIDGNRVKNGSLSEDWLSITPQTYTDRVDSTDDIFKQGSKEDDYATKGSYNFDTGNSPDKDNLSQIYYHTELNGINDSWLRVAFNREKGEGDAHIAFEFNQSDTADFHTRTDGDLLISYDYDGQVGSVGVVAQDWNDLTETWGSPVSVGVGDINTADIDEDDDGIVDMAARTFGEASIDLSALLGQSGFTCGRFGTLWARSRSSGSSTQSNVFDKVGPIAIDLDTCGSITIQKQDADESALSGAEFTLYRDNDPELGPNDTTAKGTEDTQVTYESTDPYVNPCETDANGECTWGLLEPGWYWVVETDAPAGYELPSWTERRVEVRFLTDHTSETDPALVFTDMRTPYQILVTPPPAINGVGNSHTFTVELDYWDGDSWEDMPEGTSVSLAWTTPGYISNIVDADGDTDHSGSNQPSSCSIDSDGICSVTVVSAATGEGTLTATYDTPFQNSTGTAHETTGTDPVANVDTIWDSSDKRWRAFLTEIGDSDTNLLGEPHDFTIEVWETDDGTTKDAVAADGTTVSYTWTGGPTGSTVTPDGSCTISGGQCTVTVDSDTNVGTGTVTVTSVNGNIASDTVAITQNFTNGPSASKTWVAFRVSITPPADTNYIEWDHTFTVKVERASTTDIGGFVWADASGVTLTPFWDPGTADGSAIADASECTGAPGTDSNGRCTVVVSPGADTGTGTLTVTELDGALLDPAAQATARTAIDVADASATKTWVDYAIEVTPSDTNYIGDGHDFTVTVKKDSGSGLTGANGIDVAVTWDGPEGSTLDGSSTWTGSCTTSGTGDDTGTCTFTVDSDTDVGTGTFTVNSITDDGVTDELGASASVAFDTERTKTWVRWDVTVGDSDTNLVDEPHTFTIHAWEYDGDGSEDAGTHVPEDAEKMTDATVTFTWTGTGSVTTINGSSTGLGSAPTYTCDTGSSGTCTVTVNSPTSTGTGTITVTQIDDTVGSVSKDVSFEGETATKTWQTLDASVVASATNLVDEPHTFVITADRDGTSEAGLTVTFSWNSSVGTITAINGDDDVAAHYDAGDDEYSCTTLADDGTTTGDETGTCTVTVNSSTAGSGTITVTSVGGTVGSVQKSVDFEAPRSDQQATKGWVRFVVGIAPDGHVNRSNSDHTFTVTVKKEIADGVFVAPDNGTTVDLTWTPPTPVGTGDGIASDTCTTPGTVAQVDTLTEEPLGHGTCTLSVVDDYGTGMVTATAVDGVIEVGGDPVTYDFTDHGDTDPSASKTWGDYRVTVSEDAENLLADPEHVFTVTVEERFSTDVELEDGDNWVPVEDGTFLSLDWSGDEAIAAETCSQGSGTGTNGGACTVTVTTISTGSGTLTATYGASLDSGDFTVFDQGTKTWIDYQVTVSPETAENLTVSNHVFTVLVERDSGDGEGFQSLAGVNPSLEITDGPGDILAPANLCAADGTDESGACTVTISSSETGTTTVRASYLGDAADSEAVTFGSNPATKKWVDYLIDVDPDRAVNPVGTTHTFTVTLQRIEDGVAAATAGESVALSIAGPGDIIEVPAGTIDGDARSGSCTTDAAGQCTVTISSDEVGDTTLTATYEAVAGDSTGRFSDSGLKLWRSDPAIELVKNAEIEPTAEGLKIITCDTAGCPETTFTFTVTNVGGVALSDVTVTDDVFGPITLADTELEVGESTTGTTTYVPSADEIDDGFHTNLGTATGVSPDGHTVWDTDPERVEIIEVRPTVIERPEPAPEPEPEPRPAPEPTALPRTGTDAAWMSITALLALLLGWSVVWLGRRREIEDRT